MKTLYLFLSKALIVLLILTIPMITFAQAQTKEEPKTETTKSKGVEKAPTHNYWAITVYGAGNQFNGDLSKNLLLNDKWTIGAGFSVTKQFSRVIGARLRFGWVPLRSAVENKYNSEDPTKLGTTISNSMKDWLVEANLEATLNWVNWIWGYKPERVFSSYLIAGVGLDHTQGVKYQGVDDKPENIINYLGYKTHKGAAQQGVGNNSGLGNWNLAFKTDFGLGFDFNLSKHWSINPEFILRWQNSDDLDLTTGGAKMVKNDMYSGVNLGLTYKFGYSCSLKEMEKNYGQIKYETTPPILVEKGDSVMVTIKGTVPPDYFCPNAAMYWQPQVKYEGGSLDLKPIQLMGEKVTGDGTMIRYKEGGTFTYTTVFPYKPEMSTCELVVAPVIYEAKETVIPKKDEIKAKVKYIDAPSRTLATGTIYTSKRVQSDYLSLMGKDKYEKEVIVSRNAVIYFRVNKYNLDLKFGLNKTQPAQDALVQLNEFLKQGWPIKNITIDGYASPEGEETFNVGLSENRSKTGNTYTIDQFKGFVKEAQKDNKDKKAVKAMMDAAGSDVNFVIQHHGPDWNGFMKNVQSSSIKDKDKILNVVNSAGDEKKKEQEIRNMIHVYPELEESILPPLRRAEIVVNLYKPMLTDEQILAYAKNSPEKLSVEEVLYAGTLTQNPDELLTIYENAAKTYPNDWRTLNNAAVANIHKGNLDKASSYLQKAASAAPNNGIVENNIGVVAGKQADVKKAESQFKKAQQLGENENKNLGIIAIKKGDYSKANSLLASEKCTYNLGLAQMLGGNVSGAQTTLACSPQTPDTYYLLAVCGARANNTKALYDNLMKAVADPKLKAQAKTDKEFNNYFNTPEFQNIVK